MNADGGKESGATDGGFLLSEYVSGTLPAGRAAALERRLRADPALRAEVERYAALERELAGLAQQGPPGVDYDRQRDEIIRALERGALLHGPIGRRPTVRRGLVPLAAAAAAVLAASVAWLAQRATPPRPGGRVAVVLLPAGPATEPRGPVVAAVVPPPAAAQDRRKPLFEYRKTDPGEVRLSVADPVGGPSALPPGTVMVSTAGPPEDQAPPPPLGFAGL